MKPDDKELRSWIEKSIEESKKPNYNQIAVDRQKRKNRLQRHYGVK
jgi:hypothetical protein